MKMFEKTKKDTRTGLEIAVIGMAGRFPGAKNIHQFWDNLINGVESLLFFSDEELKEIDTNPGLLENPNFVKSKGGVLEDKEYFDAEFFDYTLREAEIMDPQLRIFHECAWNALEDAGYTTENYQEPIGLFAGSSSSFNWECLSHLSGKAGRLGEFGSSQLTNKDHLTTRVSYKLDLQGPSSLIQTACSTSLVAIHLACRALLTGECKMALAGGVSVTHLNKIGYLFQEGMIFSSDGHCRTFDARAKGTIGGNGVGIVVLKRLKEAIAERDHIYAVVKGSAVNNDGIRKIGFTAPSIKGQFEVIRAAMRFARVEPESISYIEAHGTATSLGDPIEIEALKKAFNTDKKGFCRIGSVKTNVGHLDSAAGAAGFIKTVLALKHKKIPPSLHFEKPNPKIDFENSPFYVNTKPTEWENKGSPLRAGVSSFGIGGTNAHVVLEQAPVIDHSSLVIGEKRKEREYQLILLSAKTESALDKMIQNLTRYFKKNLLNRGNHENPTNPAPTLADVAYTLHVGRRGFKFRQKLICSQVNEAIEALTTPGSRKVQRSYAKAKRKQVVFLFPGIGAQYINMGWELYEKEPQFREEMDRCFEILKPLTDYNLKEILYPGGSLSEVSEVSGASGCNSAPPPNLEDSTLDRGTPAPGKGEGGFDIDQFEIAQLIIFIFEYSLAKLLITWGIKPDAMIGYSFGEYLAACISGVLSLQDALKLVVYRGELLREIPDGAMISVPLAEKELKPLLNNSDELSTAIDIGSSCIVSGSKAAVDELANRLKDRKIIGIPVKASKALHSKMMHPVSRAFKDKVGQVTLNPPDIPYISNVTGRWITANDVVDPVYWANHLKNTVRFHDGMKELTREENTLFVEVGPGRDICTMIERYIDDSTKQQAVNLVRPRQSNISDVYYLLSRIGNLWLYGATIDWSEFYSRETRYRISLPLYPFEGQRYWINEDVLNRGFAGPSRETQIKKKSNITDWFYVPGWKRTGLPSANSGASNGNSDTQGQTRWLVFVDDCCPGSGFTRRLKKEGMEVTIVKNGTAFERVSDREFIIDPQRGSDYTTLFKELGQLNQLPHEIAHFWTISPGDQKENQNQRLARAQELGFLSLIYLVRAIENQNILHDIQIGIITANVQEVTGEEVICPEKALVLGPAKVIPQEYPYIICRTIDIDLPMPGSWQEDKLIDRLLNEFMAKSLDTVIAFRNNHRWVQIFEPAQWPQPGEIVPRLKEAGVYLVTGGMGNVGFVLAETLVKAVGAKLILTGRSVLPGREEWDIWLNAHEEEDPISQKIKKIRQLEKLGAEVLVFSADAADPEQMQQLVYQAEQQFGPINGVIHAAGEKGESITRPIKFVDETVIKKQFYPKIYGLLTLEKIFRDKALDFCVFTSSLSPILGGLGFAAYSAANCFMDAFVYRYNRTKPKRWISVNWGDWDFSGKVMPDIAFGAAGNELLMTPGEGAQTFERILYHCRDHQVVVSSGDLDARIDQWVKLRSLREETPGKKEEAPVYQPRPDLENTYVKPSTRLEQSLAEVLQDFLGIEKVGINDNFFEIGATSLNLIRINRQLRIKVGKDIPIVTWFEYPTTALLAKYLEKKETGETDDTGQVDRSDVLSQGKNKLRYLRRISLEN
jgi:acyl transferase domain-containing protein/acyl carrier protein